MAHSMTERILLSAVLKSAWALSNSAPGNRLSGKILMLSTPTPAQRGSDLDVHPEIPGLGRVQIGDALPVPAWAD
jgi:hypothetical protein